jgi:undecaprenyl diphosphate synthase
MAESPTVTDTVIDNLIRAKDFRMATIDRFKAQSKIEPLGFRQRMLNKMGTLNNKAPVTKRIIQSELSQEDFPSHVSLTPDGNRRWASARGLSVGEGYAQGAEVIKDFRRWAIVDNSVDTISTFLMSTENIERRPEDELAQLYTVFTEFFNGIAENDLVHNEGIRHEVRGNEDVIQRLPEKVQNSIDVMEDATDSYVDKKMVFLLGYGGRDEIVNAARQTPRGGSQIQVSGEGEDDSQFRQNLLVGDLPDVDLFIRTSERRLSNFMLYENAYAEFIFKDIMWPSYTESDFYQDIYAYSNRDRRYGV